MNNVFFHGATFQAAPASAAAGYTAMVQQLYVGYFGRPGDPAGVAWYAQAYQQANAPANVVSLSIT